MPFIPNMDEDSQPGQGAVAPGTTGTRLSPGGIGSTPSAGSTPAPQNAGGQFATLQSYLTANQGQAEPLSGKITSGIQNQYNTLQGQNASTLGDISSQVASNAIPANSSDILAQEAANPVSFAGNKGNVGQFQGLLNAAYAGPASAESTAGFQKQQAAVNNAISQGQAATTTEAGREGLLQQNEARPTTGVTALNSAILSQDPNALNKVETAYKPFSNLVSGLSSGAQDINKSIAQTQGDVSSANAAANKAIQDQNSKLQADLQSSLSNAQNTVQQYNTAIPSYNTGRNDLNQLIANWNNYAYTSPDPNFGFKAAPLDNVAKALPTLQAMNAPTQNQVATADQLATQQALNSLAGRSLTTAIDPNAQLGGFVAPSSIPTLQPTADQIYKELQQASGQTYDVFKNAPWPAQWQYSDLLGNLNNTLAANVGQLQKYDPNLGPIAIQNRIP